MAIARWRHVQCTAARGRNCQHPPLCNALGPPVLFVCLLTAHNTHHRTLGLSWVTASSPLMVQSGTGSASSPQTSSASKGVLPGCVLTWRLDRNWLELVLLFLDKTTCHLTVGFGTQSLFLSFAPSFTCLPSSLPLSLHPPTPSPPLQLQAVH